MTIELFELRGRDDLRYSLFSWRTRMALAHKGLSADIRPILITDKEAIAFSGGKTVPVIRDGSRVVRDSWAIAEYLEDTYPERPSLFGGEAGHALTRFVNGWADRTVIPLLAPMLAADIHERIDPADQGHFRSQFERFLRDTIENHREGRESRLPAFRASLDPVRATLKAQAFLAGPAPAYADYVLFSVLQWARLTSPFAILAPDDAVATWFTRLLDHHDGLGRSQPAAAETSRS